MTPAAADSAPLPAAAAAPARVISLRDFSDRLSPMLVKELRQGLKSYIFVWGLITMQVALIIITLLSMDQEKDAEMINGWFWWSLAVPICALLPLRVANALRDESSANTLDTLLLTQLSAWRITLGKWLATCALEVLVAITVLPYLILRYFAGGVNTPLELAWLGLYVLFAMVVTAIMLGLSWFRYFLVRAIIMLGILVGTIAACAGVIEEVASGDYMLDEMYRDISWPGVIFFLSLALYLAFYCLDLGAARLAPLSENRATRRRIMGLVLLLICGACCALRWYYGGTGPIDREIVVVFASMLGMFMLLPAVQALSERPVNLAPVLMPFMKRGWAGRLAGRVFLPGWHSGIVYSLLIIGLAAAAALWLWMEYASFRRAAYGSGYSPYSWSARNQRTLITILLVTGGILTTIIMPVVIWKWTRRMHRWDFWRWLLMIVAVGAFHIFITALGSKSSPKMTWANYVFPSGAFLVEPSAQAQVINRFREIDIMPADTRVRSPRENKLLAERQSRERDRLGDDLRLQHTIVASISCILWLGLGLWLAFRELRVTGQAWRALT